MNPRRTEPPETVFETAAFDRSATPPRMGATVRCVALAEKEGFEPSMEPFSPITP